MFFTFTQNNSGGSFAIDNDVAQFVIVEADSYLEANEKAEDAGLYFSGVTAGLDCHCCGDRWYPQWSDKEGTTEPLIYDRAPEMHRPNFALEGEYYCHIYYMDGFKRSLKFHKASYQKVIDADPKQLTSGK